MNNTLQKLKDGILIGIGFMFVLSISSLVYASYTWISQTNVVSGNTLTADVWNDMVGNQNFLKQEIENIDTSNLVSKNGDTINGEINMNNNKISSLGAPTATTDAANKAYVDGVSAAGGQYVTSCATYGTQRIVCIKTNTLDGTSICKLNYNLNGWSNCVSTPW